MGARIVLFGATGYTGRLTAEAMAAAGVRPVLAGRDRARLESLATRLDAVAARLDAVEDGITGRIGNLGGTIEQGIGKLDATLLDRPDRAAVANVVQQANKDSERRSASQLDEAMATFAELILGRGAAAVQQPVLPPPRPAQRRGRSKPAVKTLNGRASAASDDSDDADLD